MGAEFLRSSPSKVTGLEIPAASQALVIGSDLQPVCVAQLSFVNRLGRGTVGTHDFDVLIVPSHKSSRYGGNQKFMLDYQSIC